MNQRMLIVGAAFLLAAFLVGFVPQYVKRGEIENELDSTRQQLAMESEKSQLDEAGLLLGNVYLQINMKNYGIAGQYASKFFDRARALESQTQNPAAHAFLQASLAKRDAVVGALAQGDASVVNAVQDLFQRALQVTQTTAAADH